MKRINARYISRAAMIAAIYALLTFLTQEFASGAIQLRFSEALCVLPLVFPEAVPGLYVGCFLANLISGGHYIDIIFGSLATLAGAFCTYKLGYKLTPVNKARYWFAMFSPILFNILITGPVVWFCYGFTGFGIVENKMLKYLPVTMLTVGLGEVLSVYLLGTLFYLGIRKLPAQLLD